MLPDLIDSYKQAALETANPTVGTEKAAVQTRILSGVSHRDIMSKATDLVVAKFPSAAKSRTNPRGPPKIVPRFDSFTDIDNMATHADTVDSTVPTPKKKRVIKITVSDAEPQEGLEAFTTRWNIQLPAALPEQTTQHEASEEITAPETTPPPESATAIRRNKAIKASGDKENVQERETAWAPASWKADLASPKARSSNPMNVSKKRSLKESDASLKESRKRLKLDPQAGVTVDVLLGGLSDTAMSRVSVKDERETGTEPAPTETVVHVHSAQDSTSESFSDQDELFTQIITEESTPNTTIEDDTVGIGDVCVDVMPHGAFPLTAKEPITSPSAPEENAALDGDTMTADTALVATPRVALEPSIRGKPPSMEINNSPVPAVEPNERTITCFRIAEALRIRATAINGPVLVSDASKPPRSIEVELFARINLTYRAGSSQVFVFEDLWFPNKPPVLRAAHKSWKQCEEEVSALLRENSQQSTEGGFLCRAMILLDTSRPTGSDGDFQGEVVCVQAAQWDEIEDVRNIVEPQYQDA